MNGIFTRFSGKRLIASAVGMVMLLISSALWAQSAATVNGKEVSNEVFNLYLESRIQKPASQATPEERTTVLGELKDIYLLTTQPRAKELAKQPRTKAQIELQTRGILAQAVATDFLTTNSASDDEITEAYEEQVASAPTMEYKARHILVETQSEAQDLVTELKDGADFAELAKTKSTGPSGPNGGDLGWFSPNQMVAPFSQAVMALDDGAFSEAPVQTQFGWHVILREESRATNAPTMESMRDVLKQQIEQGKLQKYLEDLRLTMKD